jgi:FtsH-binding integral membrane protein
MPRKLKRLKHDVFGRTEETSTGERIEARTYNLIMGLTLFWGFLVNWIIVANVSYESVASIRPLYFFIGYFVSVVAGVSLFNRATHPALSFVGYNLVVIPFGFILNLLIHRYNPAIVLDAIRITALVTLGMMVLGSLFPRFFQRIYRTLGLALLIVIGVRLIEIFIFHTEYGIIDWAIVLIFCGYIGYDWGRANRIPKTVDNAIGSAAALYIDIVNLFARILRIRGRR